MTTIGEVLTFIASEATEGDITAIYEMAKTRAKTLRNVQAATNAATLKPGDKVRLSGLSPKYMNGEVVEVVSINGSKIRVKTDHVIGRIWEGEPFGVPASCATKVDG